MKTQPVSLLIAGILALAIGCAPTPERDESTELAATEAEVGSIQDWVSAHEAAGDADDPADAMLALIADDVIWMRPDDSSLIGKDTVSFWFHHFQELYGDMATSTSSIDEVVASGDLAFVRGTRTVATPREGGQPRQTTGKFIYILQPQSDGVWKISRSIWNRNQSR